MSVNEIKQKLTKSRRLLSKASHEPDLLDPALNAIHGALEDACRGWLAVPEIKKQHGINVLDNSQASWKVLLDLLEKYCGWSKNDIRYVAKMNSLRNQNAHGEEFAGTYQQVEQYLQFVDNAIAKGGKLASDSSSDSTTASREFFPNNIRRGGKVTQFRFGIERTNSGVRIFNRSGAKIIGTFSQQDGNAGCRAVAWMIVILPAVIVLFIFTISLISSYPILGLALMLAVLSLCLYACWKLSQSSVGESNTSNSVFITPANVFIGKKSYPTPPGTYFGSTIQKTLNPEAPDLLKVYFVQPYGAVYFARSLTWHEADELIRIVLDLDRVVNEPRTLIAINAQDGLIFVKSQRTSLSFVVSYNNKLWESLYCRAIKQNSEITLIELTKSELRELRDRRLQEF